MMIILSERSAFNACRVDVGHNVIYFVVRLPINHNAINLTLLLHLKCHVIRLLGLGANQFNCGQVSISTMEWRSKLNKIFYRRSFTQLKVRSKRMHVILNLAVVMMVLNVCISPKCITYSHLHAVVHVFFAQCEIELPQHFKAYV